MFKYFTWSEIKEICIKLDNKNCYYRHPQNDFAKILGQETVDRLVAKGWLKFSPKIPDIHDYYYPCYEFNWMFRRVFNFIVNDKWSWFKYYVIQVGWWDNQWDKIKMKFGYRPTWKDYEGISLDEI